MRSLLVGAIFVSGFSFVGCSSDDSGAATDDRGTGGAAGQAGSGGTAGTSQGGTGGKAGTGAAAGSGTAKGGGSGAAGSATGGQGGSAGTAGAGGSAGSSAGAGGGGTAGNGNAGTAGSGNAGSAGSGNGGAAGGGTAGAAGASGGGAGGGNAGTGGSGGSSSTAKVGFVGVTSFATEVSGFFVDSVSATFFDGPGYSNGKGCKLEVAGACTTIVCDFTNGGDVAPPPGAFQSAGAITITGTTPPFALDFDGGMMQYLVTPKVPNDKLLFAGGDLITVTAAGGDVPAFSGSVVAPTPLTVTSPTLGGVTVDTTKDLVFTWTGSSVGKASFYVSTTTTTGGTVTSSSWAGCAFDASASTGTIPKAALAKLEKTSGTKTTGNIGGGLGNQVDVVAGDHTIHFNVASVLTQADGKTAYSAGQITIF